MPQLADYLIAGLGEKYKDDSEWVKFRVRMNDVKDLELALTGLNMQEAIMFDIIRCT